MKIEHKEPVGTDEIPDDPVVLHHIPNPDESRSKQLQ
jgi:hypothetical protein